MEAHLRAMECGTHFEIGVVLGVGNSSIHCRMRQNKSIPAVDIHLDDFGSWGENTRDIEREREHLEIGINIWSDSQYSFSVSVPATILHRALQTTQSMNSIT